MITTEIFPLDRWKHNKTGESFSVESFDEVSESVVIISDRRSVKLAAAQFVKLYTFDEPGPDPQPEPEPEPEPIAVEKPVAYFSPLSTGGRPRIDGVARYPNGRIKRNRYDFLTSNIDLGKEQKTNE